VAALPACGPRSPELIHWFGNPAPLVATDSVGGLGWLRHPFTARALAGWRPPSRSNRQRMGHPYAHRSRKDPSAAVNQRLASRLFSKPPPWGAPAGQECSTSSLPRRPPARRPARKPCSISRKILRA
jgi:hypothetical protein